MSDERGRGRPKTKHLENEHHYRTSDDASAAGAPTAAAEPQSIEAMVENPTPPVSATSTESPVEQKIHVLVEQQRVFLGEPQTIEISQLNGWHPIMESDTVINLPPRNGNPVRLAEKPDGEGVVAFWKKERAFANATKRWQEHGVWRDFYTGMKIDFEPKYWKERYV